MRAATGEVSRIQACRGEDVVHVVTALPPVACGVGDYGSQVNQALGQSWDFTPRLYAPRAGGSSDNGASLRHALQSARMAVLQYSCYGYQRYGIPNWLARALAQWKAAEPGRRLVTMFHELYAMGKPWSMSFWTSAPQRYVARSLVQLSDAAITTTHRQAKILRAWNSKIEIALLPVSSNVGELPEDQEARPREDNLIAFGLRGTRERLYRDNPEGWAMIRERMPRAVIHDVGPPTALPIAEWTGLRCESHGELSPARISELFGATRYGVLDYTRSTLDKSGVFASYCAHGMVPIVFRHATPPSSGVKEREHYVTPSSSDWSDRETARISRNARVWYGQHDLAQHARTTYRMLSLEH